MATSAVVTKIKESVTTIVTEKTTLINTNIGFTELWMLTQ
jgi:hypothetical protein